MWFTYFYWSRLLYVVTFINSKKGEVNSAYLNVLTFLMGKESISPVLCKPSFTKPMAMEQMVNI